MRCHPRHPGRVRDGGRVCILADSSSSDEEGENKLPVRPEPKPAKTTFTLFNQLPKELWDTILLTAFDPITIKGWIKIDLEWRRGPQAHFPRRRSRSWAPIPLYAVSRETRTLAATAFGAPDPRTFPFSPARDAVELVWDGTMLPTTWRRAEDYRLTGPVITGPCGGDGDVGREEKKLVNIDMEWAMPKETRERVQTVIVDGRYARFDFGLRDGVKGPWGLVFKLVKGFFAEVRVLGMRLWDLDDEGFEGSFDAVKGEALSRVDQMDFLDVLEEVWSEADAGAEAEDAGGGGGAPFPRLRLLRVFPEIPRRRRRHVFRFRKVRGSHFLVVGRGDTPTAGP
ncbi:hypothetical protein BDP81DRAFT_443103 [Colletotrichum phormii]|uniref:Uncharacterized protein n=1 Tax=Colletotrichum phormii TaxID=359342 RepID=A0AAI9ZDN5_9PEZI|nr:uncharacterized protein BDP81DRAFT_443103 [Colletotrichum phormii]KAK1621685.1 hypothetical protein BDP81DRAFT_443103 [Colletotrichum phormii]